MKIVGLEESVAQSTAGMMINVNCVFLISGNTFETLNMEKIEKKVQFNPTCKNSHFLSVQLFHF